MNGTKYAKLLKDELPTHMTIHQSPIFMHDGASGHWSKIFKKILTENHIKILDWPGKSPNLNLIEKFMV